VKAVDNAFQVADALAQDFLQRRQSSLRVSIGCVLIAIISFETFADIVPNPILGTLYPALLIGALVVYLYDKKQDYLRKHLDYRALAEGLRVQYYWNLVEVPHNVGNEYLRQHRSELDWIRSSLRSLGMMASLADSQPLALEMDRFDYVADTWVVGQRDYFAKTVQRVGKWLGRQERKISIAFVFGLSVAMVICIAQWTITDWARIWRDRLIWLLVVIPAVAAVVGNYADKLASYEQIRRYDCMIGIFDRALRKLREHLAAKDFESARELLVELGKEALEENAEWVITRRDRELDPPEAG
jgi:tetratricopeptide (TPR) repeat protein